MTDNQSVMLKQLKYILIFVAFLTVFFSLLGILIFNTLFIIDKSDAVPTGGSGIINPYKFTGDLDIDTGKIYLGCTTTPSLGIHDEHAVIYPKSDTFLYYLCDTAGQTERKFLYEDISGDVSITNDLLVGGDATITGTILSTNVGSGASYVTDLYATTGNFTQIEATDINVNRIDADEINVTTANVTTINVLSALTTATQAYGYFLIELSSDPSNQPEGQSVMWQSDGTGAGDDGDIMIKITAGATTKTITLVDFSAF